MLLLRTLVLQARPYECMTHVVSGPQNAFQLCSTVEVLAIFLNSVATYMESVCIYTLKEVRCCINGYYIHFVENLGPFCNRLAVIRDATAPALGFDRVLDEVSKNILFRIAFIVSALQCFSACI